MTHPDTLIPRAVVGQSITSWREQCSETTTLGAQLVLMQAEIDNLRAALQPQATPPATQAAPVSLQAAHDAVTIDTLNDRVMRQQAALTAALEALHKAMRSVYDSECSMYETCKSAIAQIEALKGPTP